MGSAALDTMRSLVRGPVITARDPDYDRARQVYNAMIDKRPAAIVRCTGAADVRAAVAFARDKGLEVAVRGGGHSIPGLCLADGGLTIDLGLMHEVETDPAEMTVRVGGGSLGADVDQATHIFGLATPLGIISSTGAAGLTLGGGHGHLTRSCGLTVDNLLAAEVVLADGSAVTATATEHPDLFWALRGGGGNFGIATSLTYRLHRVAVVGMAITLWPIESIGEVLRWYREFLPQAPEELSGFFAVLAVPPGPPFPEEFHLRRMCAVVWCHRDPERMASDLRPVSEPGAPAVRIAEPMPYPVLQGMFDPLLPAGLQWYWRGDFFDRITDDAIEVHGRYGSEIPTPLSTMHLYPVDGAVHRVAGDGTAWSYRDAVWSASINGIDPDPANAELIRDWCVRYWEDLHPHSMGGGYVNFLGAEEGRDRVRATYRGAYGRLADVKREYDPDNVFHVNQNIPPAPPH